MVVVNTDYITGKNLDMIGLVQGSCVQPNTSARTSAQASATWWAERSRPIRR